MVCDLPQAFLVDGLGFDVGVPSGVVVSPMKPAATRAHWVRKAATTALAAAVLHFDWKLPVAHGHRLPGSVQPGRCHPITLHFPTIHSP